MKVYAFPSVRPVTVHDVGSVAPLRVAVHVPEVPPSELVAVTTDRWFQLPLLVGAVHETSTEPGIPTVFDPETDVATPGVTGAKVMATPPWKPLSPV